VSICLFGFKLHIRGVGPSHSHPTGVTDLERRSNKGGGSPQASTPETADPTQHLVLVLKARPTDRPVHTTCTLSEHRHAYLSR
jgi:hypothetical protein